MFSCRSLGVSLRFWGLCGLLQLKQVDWLLDSTILIWLLLLKEKENQIQIIPWINVNVLLLVILQNFQISLQRWSFNNQALARTPNSIRHLRGHFFRHEWVLPSSSCGVLHGGFSIWPQILTWLKDSDKPPNVGWRWWAASLVRLRLVSAGPWSLGTVSILTENDGVIQTSKKDCLNVSPSLWLMLYQN